ncbi:MAG: protein kinase [Polyangiaceae bacterium]
MPLSPGDHLTDSLVLEQELGSGGMGTVWRAKNLALGSHVAVKVLRRAEDGGSPEARRRFEAEARGLAQLDHPNLVRIFDFGMSPDGDPFIVMELLRGEDLASRLAKGRLDLATTAEILRQTCRALQRAHDAGVIHRDIKPANIFLVELGDDIHVKLLDFGIARFGASAKVDTATKTGAVLGTPYFMSPEQLLSPKGIDHRTDLWSVGVVAYYCLAGAFPFEGETLTALGIAVVAANKKPITAHRPEFPRALDVWFDRALARDPAQRYASAKDLAEAFDRARAAMAAPTGAPAGFAAPPGASQSTAPSHAPAAASLGTAPAPPRPNELAPTAAPFAFAATAPIPAKPPVAAPVAGTAPSALAAPPVLTPAPRSRLPVVLGSVAVLVLVGGGATLGYLATRGDAPPSTRASASPPSKTAAAAATTGALTVTPAPTPTPSPRPTPAPTPTSTPPPRTPDAVTQILIKCWDLNVKPGTPNVDAEATYDVDEGGKIIHPQIHGSVTRIAGYAECCTERMSELDYGPGPLAKGIVSKRGFPAR